MTQGMPTSSDRQLIDESVQIVHFRLRDDRMAPAIPAKALVTFDRLNAPNDGEVIAIVMPNEGYDIGRYRIVKGREMLQHDNERYEPRRIGRSARILGTMIAWRCAGSK